MSERKEEPPKVVAGWKEIARYLGKGVRTVQRYEREMGLPIRRPAGRSRAAVIATKAELDAWVAASPVRMEFSLPKPTPDTITLTLQVTHGVAEMRRLREQMQALRNEVISTVSLLRGSVRNLHRDIAFSWAAPVKLSPLLPSEGRNGAPARRRGPAGKAN
jgi:hypothetical protein